jgi:hypothetical protein
MWTAVWLGICSLAALPSFMIAAGEGYDAAGMSLGVLVFVVVYVAVSCTDNVTRRWTADRAFRTTAIVGYSLRLILGLVFPLGVMVDIWPGALAVELVGSLPLAPRGFLAALLTTLVQGCFLNLILAVFMSVLYVIMKSFMRSTTEARGFMVLPPRS